MKYLILWGENLKISFSSIRSNRMRTFLTISIIAIGITALVGILTAIDAIKGSITSEFSRMGAQTFSIESRGMVVFVNGKRYRQKNHAQITYAQANRFKREYDFPATTSVSVVASHTGTAKYKNNTTDPNIRITGADEDYLTTNGYEIDKGRNFSNAEVISGAHVVILGSDLSGQIFPRKQDPLNEVVSIGNGKYKVIGVMKEKGSSMGGGDRFCIVPLTNARQYFSYPSMSFRIDVLPDQSALSETAKGEAEGLFRKIRKLGFDDESDFNINQSDNLAQLVIDNLQYVAYAATLIGFITLVGAAVGLMNIMLVAVAERTREIGTRKAIGATSDVIRQQFLFESLAISLIGGLLGIVVGVLVGNLVSTLIGSPFIMPWKWILAGIGMCSVVGILSGLLPAIKASRLDPIEALRYE